MSRKCTLFVINFSAVYLLSLPTAGALYKCSYENTINVTDSPTLANGFYIYNNQTIIADHLVSNYSYEILYDGRNRSVPVHKRACLCHLKPCIPLCSNSLLEVYRDVLNDQNAGQEVKDLFLKNITLSNGKQATRNLAKDFAHIVLNEFCKFRFQLSPEKDADNGWTLYEDGTLLRHSDHLRLRRNEYCFELYLDVIENETYSLINPFNCAKKKEGPKARQKVQYWTQVLSVPFFLLTIIAYFSLPELRDVHGKCFMTYLSCVTISYSILSFINLSEITFDKVPCLLMGYINHYMQLSQYTWLGIISLDTWRTFSELAYKASYYQYALFGYHIPLFMTLLTFLAQHSVLITDDLKPGISRERCGLKVNKWAALIYLYGPCSIILICCLIFFILTSRIIKANDKEVLKLNEMQSETPRTRYALYLRLFLIMGLSWFLDIISYFLNMLKKKNLSELFDYINALQGLYVFVNFIGRTRVRHIILNRFSVSKRSVPVIELHQK